MKASFLYPLILLVLFSACHTSSNFEKQYSDYDESAIIEKNRNHEKSRMRYKLVQSRVLNKFKLRKNIQKQLEDFTEKNYKELYSFIYEQDIPTIQKHIDDGILTYKQLVQWYLYRIDKYEFDPNTSLHTIIEINHDAVAEAEALDLRNDSEHHLILGMPILLKDNINTSNMHTTAGAIALENNYTEDAFIVERLKENGAIILGKVNLSEWAYFFCSGCPVGYSAIGGQTLNPYGRAEFETGGSSSGSGTSMAANYAVGAVGTETSGSILSPSSQNSVVGLKPTVGLLSRTGIVPISSTLDTPGPITRNVVDNAILLSAMLGKDSKDEASIDTDLNLNDLQELTAQNLEGFKIGANKEYMNEYPLYAEMMVDLYRQGVTVFGFSPSKIKLSGFRSILNVDMRNDLPKYLKNEGSQKNKVKNISDVIAFNEKDRSLRAPYGQELFEGILKDTTSEEELEKIIQKGRKKARSYFDVPMEEFDFEIIASINNYDASLAALALYPALTLPMGYKDSGEPMNLTLIAKSGSEQKLLQVAFAIEKVTQRRRPPSSMIE